jgi:hypothetical protein
MPFILSSEERTANQPFFVQVVMTLQYRDQKSTKLITQVIKTPILPIHFAQVQARKIIGAGSSAGSGTGRFSEVRLGGTLVIASWQSHMYTAYAVRRRSSNDPIDRSRIASSCSWDLGSIGHPRPQMDR